MDTMKVVDGQTVFEVRIDMAAGNINWLQDGNDICKYSMGEGLKKQQLHPVVYLCEKDDQLEFQEK